MYVWVLCYTDGEPHPVVFETRKDAYNNLKEFLMFMELDNQLEELERQYHSDNCEDDIELEQYHICKASYYKEGEY